MNELIGVSHKGTKGTTSTAEYCSAVRTLTQNYIYYPRGVFVVCMLRDNFFPGMHALLDKSKYEIHVFAYQ